MRSALRNLDERQLRILSLLGSVPGITNKEIAQAVGNSVKTIRNELGVIYKALGLSHQPRNRWRAANWAHEHKRTIVLELLEKGARGQDSDSLPTMEAYWEARFRNYYRLWVEVENLVVVLGQMTLWDEKTHSDDWLAPVWFFGRFSLQLKRFLEEGWDWRFTSDQAEMSVVSDVNTIRGFLKLSQREISSLRRATRDFGDEFEDFRIHILNHQEAFSGLIHRWQSELTSCTCSVKSHSIDCRLRPLLDSCLSFLETVDKESAKVRSLPDFTQTVFIR